MGRNGSSEGAAPSRAPVLAVTCGDPCGIGPEIVLKALADEDGASAARLLAVGDEQHMRKTARDLKLKWPFASVVKEPPEGNRWGRPQLLDLGNVHEAALPGQVSAQAGRAAGEAIEAATVLALEGKVDGVVTSPIHKQALSMAGYEDSGHTELLARLSGVASDRVGMLFYAQALSVGLLTTHLSVKEAVKKVRTGRIVRMLKLFHEEWQRFFGVVPRIAVAALNPHAGESGRFGVEESRYIVPAVQEARRRKLSVAGPFPADSVFVRAREGEFDLVLALYHDQGTIPVKLLYGRESVNVTVGLPFVRTSVDHGTAMEIAGKGTADAGALVQAIKVGASLAVRTAAERAAAD